MGRLKAATPVTLVTAICAMGLLTACGDGFGVTRAAPLVNPLLKAR